MTEQELVAYAFAPLDGQHGPDAIQEIRDAWQRGRDLLGTDRPVPMTGLPDRVPDDVRSGPESQLLAIQESADGHRQVLLRREHDVLSLAVLCAAPVDLAYAPTWNDQRRDIDRLVQPHNCLLGTAQLYLAKARDARDDAVLRLCPVQPGPAQQWRSVGIELPASLAAWELTDADPGRSDRIMVVIAPPDQDRMLGLWTWSRGVAEEMGILARYLMHLAKLRYEVRAHRRSFSATELSQSLRATAQALMDPGSSPLTPSQNLRTLRFHQARAGRLVTLLTGLKLTATIAADNAVNALGSVRIDTDGSVADDQNLAGWFSQCLEDEVSYLRAALDGARIVTEAQSHIFDLDPDSRGRDSPWLWSEHQANTTGGDIVFDNEEHGSRPTNLGGAQPPRQRIRILMLAANPAATSQPALAEEAREIAERLQLSQERDTFELITHWAVRPADLLQHLNQYRPQIVHFSGHGSATGEVVLSTSTGGEHPVSAAALADLFRVMKDDIRIVILNAGYSTAQAQAISQHIDYIIGMRTPVGDRAATVFAAAFYSALGFRRTVQEAFDQATTALMLHGLPDYVSPQLIVRDVGVGLWI